LRLPNAAENFFSGVPGLLLSLSWAVAASPLILSMAQPCFGQNRPWSVAEADVADLEHDPEKWLPVFRKDHAQNKKKGGMTRFEKVIAASSVIASSEIRGPHHAVKSIGLRSAKWIPR